MDKEEYSKFIFEYNSKNGFAISRYYRMIINCLEDGRRVPPRLILKLYALFIHGEEKEARKNAKINDVVKNTLSRFDKYKYNFKKERPKLPAGQTYNLLNPPTELFMMEYSLEAMLRVVLKKIIGSDGKEIYKEKDEFIFYAHKFMGEYQKYYDVPKDELKEYKKLVLSAYLSSQVNLHPTEIKKSSPTQLRDAARNAIRQYENRMRKKSR